MVPSGSAEFKELWTYQDVADFLNISDETIRKKVAAREIPFVKLGRLVRFDPSDIRRWVDAQKNGGHADPGAPAA